MSEVSVAPSPRIATRPDDGAGGFLKRCRELPGDPSDLAELVKADLRRRFDEGDRPAVADYLDAIPGLRDDSERVLSLIYEEFCLREEAGEAPDPDSFCDRYAPWRDSLASQLNYHRMISQAAGVLPGIPPRFPEPGEEFLRFRLRSVLGQGGAARVFLADEVDLGGRLSALKVSPDRGDEPSIMGRLQHPHIMPVHSVVRDPETGLRGLCMPYRPGRPLDQVLRRMENIPPRERSARTLLDAAAPEDLAAKPDGPGWAGFPRRGSYADACAWLAAALADALGHAHDLDILHRDVKPANVLLSAADGPQLLDFNLAHDPHAPERAESALRGGTLPYMAPEQLEAFRDPERWDEVGPTADTYALGLVLSELLTGRRPEAPADLSLPRVINDLLAHRIDGWPSIRDANPTVPHALDAIVRRCLAPKPADRYPDASALADDLRAFLRRRPLAHATNPSRRERTENYVRRNRAVLLVASLAATMVIASFASRSVASGLMTDMAGHQLNQAIEKPLRTQSLLDRAGSFWRFALRLDPESYRAYDGLGCIAFTRGRYQEAEQYRVKSYDIAATLIKRKRDGLVNPADPELRALYSHLIRLHIQRAFREVELGKASGEGTSSYNDHLRIALSHLESATNLLPLCEPHIRFKYELMYARVLAETVMRRYDRDKWVSPENKARLIEASDLLDHAIKMDDPGIKIGDRDWAINFRELIDDKLSLLDGPE